MTTRFVAQNLAELFLKNVQKHPQKQAFWYRYSENYSSLTYKDIWNTSQQLAQGLLNLGFKAQEGLAILSYNRPEWVVADLASFLAKGHNVPIYTTLTAHEILYILNNSKASALLIETEANIETLLSIVGQCTHLKCVISLAPLPPALPDGPVKWIYWDDILELGQNKPELTIDNDINALASIVYTSGTTGFPKGVMLTHANFLANLTDILEVIPVVENDTVLSFLPLCHAFERTAGYYAVVAAGGVIYYAESIQTVSRDMVIAKPTVVVSVPRLYEKMHAKILESLKGLKKILFFWAQRINLAYKNNPQKASFWTRFQLKIAKFLVISKLQKRTGGRLRFFVSGGAPLNPNFSQFFYGLDLFICEGYGLTEASPVIACNRLNQFKLGSVGLPLGSLECKLSADGELLVKGPSIMKGYWQRPEESSAILVDGWLHTGDIATIDEEGFIFIIDRKKELIVLSNGKKVPPQVIEQAVLLSSYVSQVMIAGESKNYLTALIVPNKERVIKWATNKGIAFENYELLLEDSRVKSKFEFECERTLKDFAPYEKIKRFSLIANEWSQDTGELTPSLKLKRKIMLEKYQDLINTLYS